jgi:signal transduction histidine kinase
MRQGGAAPPGVKEAAARPPLRRTRNLGALGMRQAPSRPSLRRYAQTAVIRLLASTPDGEGAVVDLGRTLAHASESVRLDTLSLVVHDPRLLEPPPRRAIELQLHALIAFAPITDASLWAPDASARVRCVLHLGRNPTTRRMRQAAVDLLAGRPPRKVGPRALISAVRVHGPRTGTPHAILVVRSDGGAQQTARAYAEESARGLALVLENERCSERIASQQRLLEATERRMARQRYDLHDGALQHINLLIANMAHLQHQVAAISDRLVESQAMAQASVDELREVMNALPAVPSHRNLETSVRRQLRDFEQRTGTVTDFTVEGIAKRMTPSQHIAVLRVVQEALTNVRAHSKASRVEIALTHRDDALFVRISDNGRGFDRAKAEAAEQSGSIGLLGMRDRIALVGGRCAIESRPGGPTVISLFLPRLPQSGCSSNTIGWAA